jgi:hypothetical protein
MAHPNEELLRKGFEAFSLGDMEAKAVAALLADDIVLSSRDLKRLAPNREARAPWDSGRASERP